MKILNLHGFMGEADNKNYKALCDIISPDDIISPKMKYMELSPSELLEKLSEYVDTDDFLFVGQSLGGWFADKLSRKYRRPCILTNPCYYPHELELITASGIPAEFVEEYRKMSVSTQNERAYTLCSDADTILPANHADCVKLSETIKAVHGSHSTIENIGGYLSEMLTEIQNDRLLLFLGRGSAFADEHDSAFFVEDNELVLIDCPATSYQKVKKMNWEQYDNIYILVTHTHGDHSGGVGTMLQYVWFASCMKKKVTIVAPSAEVKDDLLLLLMRIEGCEQEWFHIVTADELDKKWFAAAVPTAHVKPLEGRCFGYHLSIHGNNAVYTGDTATLEPFKPLLKSSSFLYTEAAYYKSEVHLHLKEMLPEFIKLADSGVHVYLMHLDAESEIKSLIADTPLKLVQLL
ncbi:MAG: MBL fold metallo-hydrolase [Ruminococcus sp.]|uniref:YqiA/YcfP family alpha/beta fold hydrolase n=1 Tax=Ruminococcus sp. TaxID=41978 RepID=UPI0025FCD282|nr:YqiA/YcfP family alpha/beta fold hydrolase [Ruminococcus sp.]MCR5600383.1 MBL fold metallo-hydrolase [Ruminococcus sp.]